MDSLVALLLNWIAANTHYEFGDIPHPAVIELTAQELTRELYRDVPDSIPDSGVDDRIQALYSWEDGQHGTIYILERDNTKVSLSQETGLDNPLFQERLLHELVHHVQYVTGEYDSFTCMKEGELAAYQYAGKFLRQQSVADPLPNRRILAHLYSRC